MELVIFALLVSVMFNLVILKTIESIVEIIINLLNYLFFIFEVVIVTVFIFEIMTMFSYSVREQYYCLIVLIKI